MRRADPKQVHVQVTGVAGVVPDRDRRRLGQRVAQGLGDARRPRHRRWSRLPVGTRTSLVLVTYGGDASYLPWIGAPRLLVVR